MVQADGGEPTPLYTFDDRDYQIAAAGSGLSRSYLKITNGNHLKCFMGRRGESYQVYFSLTNSAVSFQSSWPSMFTLHAGDIVALKLKNVYIYSDQSSSSTGFLNFRLKTSGTETNITGWGTNSSGNSESYPLYFKNKTAKRVDELSTAVELTADKNAGCFCLYNYGTQQSMHVTFEADVELYVNGVRYI